MVQKIETSQTAGNGTLDTLAALTAVVVVVAAAAAAAAAAQPTLSPTAARRNRPRPSAPRPLPQRRAPSLASDHSAASVAVRLAALPAFSPVCSQLARRSPRML